MSAGIFPPDDLFAELTALANPLLNLAPDLVWVPPPLWHLPLAYFGNITLQDVDLLNDAISADTDKWASPCLRIDGAEMHSTWLATHALCFKVTCRDDGLQNIRNQLLDIVHQFGWLLDRRSFRPEISLARGNSSTDATSVSDAVARLAHYQSKEWPVTSIAVLWIRNGANGQPVYELLAEHAFGF